MITLVVTVKQSCKPFLLFFTTKQPNGKYSCSKTILIFFSFYKLTRCDN